MIDADVAASQGAARWSVAECGWKKLLPDLPDDVIALLRMNYDRATRRVAERAAG